MSKKYISIYRTGDEYATVEHNGDKIRDITWNTGEEPFDLTDDDIRKVVDFRIEFDKVKREVLAYTAAGRTGIVRCKRNAAKREELAQTIHDISETCELIKTLGSQIHTDARDENENTRADTVEEIPCDGEPRFIGLSRQGQLIFFCFKREHNTTKGELFYAFPNRGEDILGRKCSEVLGKLPENGMKNEIRQHIRKLCEYDGLEILATERIDENEFIDKVLNNIDFFIILYDLANLELARRNIRTAKGDWWQQTSKGAAFRKRFSKLDADERRTTLSFLTGRLMQDDAECNEEWEEWISSEEVAIVDEITTKLPKMLRVIDHALWASLSNDDNEDTNAPENTRKRALEDATAGIFASADSEEYEKMLAAIGRFPEIGDMLAERHEIMIRVAQTTARARALERKVKAWIDNKKP
ncbi:unnamed protein product [Cylicocyclus nassatus]|uniref:Uncharacterized protein n=1 Tax=Cylicocyclus nassatus TaxID=53992 RepID=A0AA36GKF8_CYLNA|nr:unnamed protein product [Cylicocyclus nassatus]